MSDGADRSKLAAAVDNAGKRIRVVGKAALRRNPELVYLALADPDRGLLLDRRLARRDKAAKQASDRQ